MAKNLPPFWKFFGPVLDALRELGGSGTPQEVIEVVARTQSISEEQQSLVLKSGASSFANRIRWARQYLVWADLLDASRRGVWSLTEQGRTSRLTPDAAKNLFKEIHARVSLGRSEANSTGGPLGDESGEAEDASPTHRKRLLEILRALPPAGFERLCQRLLRESGFTHVSVTGRSGDGGIDGHGTLQLNPLVSFKVLFQCKRYKDSVSAGQVRDFRGAMQGRADKGIILTTGSFTTAAREEAIRDGAPPIELVDHEKLLSMFEALELGLRPTASFRVEEDFFDEFAN